jgi:nitrite reductase (NADH) small subunit
VSTEADLRQGLLPDQEAQPVIEWIDVCGLEDIPAPGARRVRIGAATIALLRPGGERVFALEDRCPHKGGPLSEGIVSHDRVACPLHGRCIDLASGRMVAPDEGEALTFVVRIEAGRVLLRRDALRALVATASPAPRHPARERGIAVCADRNDRQT